MITQCKLYSVGGALAQLEVLDPGPDIGNLTSIIYLIKNKKEKKIIKKKKIN